MRVDAIVLTTVLISSLVTGCVSHQPRAQITQQLTGEHLAAAPIAVETHNGSVHIIGGSEEQTVKIETRITCEGATDDEANQRLAATEINITRAADRTLLIKSDFPGGCRPNDAASFIIHLPSAVGATVKTSNGSVSLRNLAGCASVKTSNGSVTVSNHAGPAVIETSNGSVSVAGVLGAVHVETSNASVDARQIGGPAQITTSNGAIRVALNPDVNEPINLRSSNGSVRATVGAHFAGRIDMQTSNGSLRIHDPAGRITKSHVNHHDGSVEVGEGAGESRIATSNGRIELEIAN